MKGMVSKGDSTAEDPESVFAAPLWAAMKHEFEQARRDGCSENEAWQRIAGNIAGEAMNEAATVGERRDGPDIIDSVAVVQLGYLDTSISDWSVQMLDEDDPAWGGEAPYGRIAWSERTIQINRSYPRLSQIHTLIHELVHAGEMLRTGGVPMLSEPLVDDIAYIVNQGLVALGMFPFTDADFDEEREHRAMMSRRHQEHLAQLREWFDGVSESMDRDEHTAYTVGRHDVYRQPETRKAKGGSVWATFDEAAAHLPVFDVHGVEVPGGVYLVALSGPLDEVASDDGGWWTLCESAEVIGEVTR